MPADSIVGEMLKKNGDSELKEPTAPNDCWSAAFKGAFLVKGKAYCYPLTVMDMTSRYLLRCEGLSTIDFKQTQRVFE